MNGSTENRASNPFEQSEKQPVVLNLGTARRMLPLISRIVADIVHCQQRLALLRPEESRLDRQRHALDWPDRQRRYQVREEIASLDHHLQDAQAELEVLGAVMVVLREGRVGLPTVVNGQLAYFSWKPGEDTLKHWHFAGELTRRNIPTNWKETGEIRLVGRAR